MSDPSLLAERLAAVRARHPQASDGISEALRAVMETVAGGVPATEGSLLGEVEALGRTIATAKAEIARIPAAADADCHAGIATG